MAGSDRSGRPFVGLGESGPSTPSLRFRSAVPDLSQRRETIETIEIIGTHLHAVGSVSLGRFDRLSDFVAVQSGFVPIQNVIVLRPAYEPLRPQHRLIWVAKDRITLIAQREVASDRPHMAGVYVTKVTRRLAIVTDAHAISGLAYLHVDAEIESFLDAPDPVFVPLSHVEIMMAGDPPSVERFEFVLLNRRSITAVTEADPRALDI